MGAKGIQYTIRGIPQDVDKALRRRAKQRGISLNRLLVEKLCAAAGVLGEPRYRSLKSLGGRWREDPEFERILAEQRRA